MGMTRQRRLILDIVRNSPEHLTAEDVYLKAKEEINNIGLGTVYRNLGILSDEGIIRRVEVSGAPDRYDKNVSPHEHARCVKCGRLTDCSVDMSSLLKSSRLDGFEILGVDLKIIGLCKKCAAEEKGEKYE